MFTVPVTFTVFVTVSEDLIPPDGVDAQLYSILYNTIQYSIKNSKLKGGMRPDFSINM